MRRLSSYHQAVVLLGGESALTGLLDKVSSLALFGLGGIDLFDARAEAVRLGDGLIRKLRDQAHGLSRYDRTQRLAAAHAVVVITAYFEALEELIPKDTLTREDQEHIAGTGAAGHWVERLIAADLPIPGPQLPYENVLVELRDRYEQFSRGLCELISGLSFWDGWDETRRERVLTHLMHMLPKQASRRYEELFLRLATDFPDVARWADRADHRATRAAIARGLAGLEEHLRGIASGRKPADRLDALLSANRAALDRRIVDVSDTPEGLTIPLLGPAYVTPSFRVLPPGRGSRPADESSWKALPRRDDLAGFLSGHLTLPQSTQAPLIILGQPGAGKSALTKILAARLPGDFLPIRVELRAVPADSDVLGQIEHAIRDALDETMSWPELVDAGQGALPVVMLDGFDELLQATGVNQTDYLMKVAEFQRRQAERKRALAVIVTSRTAVADRARLPEDALVVRLEPFDEAQVGQWVATWNQANHDYFAENRPHPLVAEDVLAVADLAGQPLLLLMLALYDADTNALRAGRDRLDEAELYERLLIRFAEREVRKTCKEPDIQQAVEDELRRLSVTAFAMFNRGRQWVAEPDLDHDLQALFGEARDPSGFRRGISGAEAVIGGFFFVHKAQASRDEQRLTTYEFLHATFGEYLVARLITLELADFSRELSFAASRNRPTLPDDAFLHALLSFAVLTVRAPIVSFLEYGMRHRIPERELLRRHLCSMVADAMQARSGSRYDGYAPAAAGVPARYAAYSANVLLLCVLAAGEPVPGTELFRERSPGPANERWRQLARLWHSQLTRDEWDSLLNTVRVRHTLENDVRTMTVRREDGAPFQVTELTHFTWSGDLPPERDRLTGHYEQEIPVDSPLARWPRSIAFLDDDPLARLFTNLLPYATHMDPYLDEFLDTPDGKIIRPADMLELLLAQRSPADQRIRIYERILCYPRTARDSSIALERLSEECGKLPAADVVELLAKSQSWMAARSHFNTARHILWRLDGRPGLDVDRHLGLLTHIENKLRDLEADRF